MQTTGNLGLKKPEYTDVADVADFNANADILDTEVAKLASTTEAGRMSAADKVKLNGVAAGANNYVAPSASLTVKGDVQLSSATNSTSETLAATPAAVKAAYDRGSTGVTAAAAAQAKADAALPTASYTAADVLAKIKTVDGAGSGLDADLLDGLSSSDLMRSGGYWPGNDADACVVNGCWTFQPGANHTPLSDWFSMIVFGSGDLGRVTQLGQHYNGGNEWYIRRYNNGAWSSWNYIMTPANTPRLREFNGQLEFNSIGVWTPVGYDPSRYNPFQLSSINTALSAGTYVPILNKTGGGYLSWALVGGGYSHPLSYIRITVDGVVKVVRVGGGYGTNSEPYASGFTKAGMRGGLPSTDGSSYHEPSGYYLFKSTGGLGYPVTSAESTTQNNTPLILPDNIYYKNSLKIEVNPITSGNVSFSIGGADLI